MEVAHGKPLILKRIFSLPDGRALFVHFKKGTVLHYMNFKHPVVDAKFSPDGKSVHLVAIRFNRCCRCADFSLVAGALPGTSQ
jgi:hypothetical protein